MRLTPEKIISEILRDSVVSGSELYVPASKANLAIDISAEIGYAVFRVEIFFIENNEIKPILKGIYDVFPNSNSFAEFVEFSSASSKAFIEEFHNETGKGENIYANFIFDNSFD